MIHVEISLADGRISRGFGQTESNACVSAYKRLGEKADRAYAWPGGVVELICSTRVVAKANWKRT